MKILNKDWFKPRKYLHFDLPINRKKASKIVSNSETVAKHAFYPLINYDILINKIKKNPITKNIMVSEPKKRPISYPAHIDSHIYSYYSKKLNHQYEKAIKENGLNNSILAFRTLGKNNIDFSLDAFNEIKKLGECSAVALDITKFFDTLDHDILKSEWCKLLGLSQLPKDHYNIFKSITRYSTVNKEYLYKALGISLNNPNKTRRRICEPHDFRSIVRKYKLIKVHKESFGIPQGTPLSAILSNIYMFDFDLKMNSFITQLGGKYFRYCDDILFITPTEHKLKVKKKASFEIESLKLELNKNKTEIRTFKFKGKQLKSDKPLQYLGFIFDGNNIYIRSSSLARYSSRMHKGVRLAKNTMIKYNKIRRANQEEERLIFKRKLYSRYSYLGKRNFITYGYLAAKK
ncbi:antiviral reverse transcriptase Drt2 [Photobacterium leiognathi]|uniref:antiviral reverse transcriptase Drt2 n=1 Tax=Photobacterium leiognathi TaxID=553611 RepID=UPI002734E567|nr:antiviral reverse transcriptase Drt2 [Photobacterium leiognathi]